jgi:hypothetical protein
VKEIDAYISATIENVRIEKANLTIVMNVLSQVKISIAMLLKKLSKKQTLIINNGINSAKRLKRI